MANNQEPKRRTEPEKDEPVLLRRMIRIGYKQGVFIEKYRRSLLEGDLVFLDIDEVLRGVPLELDAHELHCSAFSGRRQPPNIAHLVTATELASGRMDAFGILALLALQIPAVGHAGAG
jgi:hypothetical protein